MTIYQKLINKVKCIQVTVFLSYTLEKKRNYKINKSVVNDSARFIILDEIVCLATFYVCAYQTK